MDSRIAILGNNGTGKSTLLNLITGDLRPCEGTVSKHAALKLAKYSQHSADQLPYDKSPIEHFQSLYYEKYPDKDIMVKSFFDLSIQNHVQLPLNSFGELNWVDLVSVVPIKQDLSNIFPMGYETGMVPCLSFGPFFISILSQGSIFSTRDGASAYTAFGYADLSCFLAFL